MATSILPHIGATALENFGTLVRVRHLRSEDLPRIPGLMRRVYAPPQYGPEAVWSEHSLARHLEIYPQGQFVAVTSEGRLAGTATGMRVPLSRALAPHTWQELTARGTLESHDPQGKAFYGVNIAVDPELQGLGIGRLLYQARLRLGHEEGCLAFVAGARLAGYHRHHGFTPEAYLLEVCAHRIYDPTLSKQLALGFVVRGLLRDYAPDPQTGGHAALIYRAL